MHEHDTAHTSAHPLPDNHPTPLQIPLSEIDYTQGETTTPKRLHLLKRLHRNPLMWICAGGLFAWITGYAHMTGGILFAVVLFYVNTFVDGWMTGGDS